MLALPGSAGAITQTFYGSDTFTVPAGVSSIHLVAIGEAGKGHEGRVARTAEGGQGARLSGEMTVTPGEALYIHAGEANGGEGGAADDQGGGSTSVTSAPAFSAEDALLVAAGGGGGGAEGNEESGGDGGNAGEAGEAGGAIKPGKAGEGGAPGTLGAGGKGGRDCGGGASETGEAGAFDLGGYGVSPFGAEDPEQDASGGGGGGYYGGGAGGYGCVSGLKAMGGGGGGGGSSLVPPGFASALEADRRQPQVKVSYGSAAAPTVTSVTPAEGSDNGGTTVEIVGTNLGSVEEVYFGSTEDTNFTVNSQSSITATTPPGTGTVEVTVSGPEGSSAAEAADSFSYEANPEIHPLIPDYGPPEGGTPVTITGQNLQHVERVTFGSTEASFRVESSSSISATSPAGTGNVPVHVEGPSGRSNEQSFHYGPQITGFSPPEGDPLGGTSVTITGRNFTSGAQVYFGGNEALSVTVESSTSIVATAPAGSGSVTVRVTTPGGSAETPTVGFSYQPTVTSISPSTGPARGGTPVVITGKNFYGVESVEFESAAATEVTVVSPTEITAVTPPGEGDARVLVITKGGESQYYEGTKFRYDTPYVTQVSPKHGPPAGGTPVVITGGNFDGATKVEFGGEAAESFTVTSESTIEALTPAHAEGYAEVRVTTPEGTTPVFGSQSFEYSLPPVISKLKPARATTAGGSKVEITIAKASCTESVSEVRFGSVAASFSWIKGRLYAIAPAEEAGTVYVSITDGCGTSEPTSTDKFTYLGAPTITGVEPARGPVSGGTSVTVTGTGFALGSGTSFRFGSVSASKVDCTSKTSCTVEAPPAKKGKAGVVDVTAKDPKTSAKTAADHYEYF